MPVYVRHQEIEVASILCPGCIGLLSMQVRLVEPHWSSEQIDIIYECPHCGGEVRQSQTAAAGGQTELSEWDWQAGATRG